MGARRTATGFGRFRGPLVVAASFALVLTALAVPWAWAGPGPASPSGSGPAAGSFTPATGNLTAGPALPASPSLDPGQSLVLSVNVSGGIQPYSFRWYSGTYPQCSGDTGVIGSATNSSLNVSYAYADLYYCYTVTDNESPPASATPASATLVAANPSLTAGPASPASATIDSGRSVVLTARPSGGSGQYSVVWFSSASGSPSCTLTEVGTGSTFTASPTTNTSYCYRVMDTAEGTPPASALSPPDTVTVDPALSAGGVMPITPTVDLGQGIALTAAPSGGTGPGTYTIQWYSGLSSICPEAMTGVGTNSTTFTATPRTSIQFCYSVRDTSYGTPTVYSLTDTVQVSSKLAAAKPSPASPGIDVGQTLTLTANVTGGTLPYGFQWYNGYYANCSAASASPVAGATASTFALTPGSSEYLCYSVTDGSAIPVTVFSPSVLVRVNSTLLAGASSPVSPTLDKGQSAKLTANPSGGTPPYTYTWYSGQNSSCAGDTTATRSSTGPWARRPRARSPRPTRWGSTRPWSPARWRRRP
jgi:hypothetical protein